jgi:hypothetical protein
MRIVFRLLTSLVVLGIALLGQTPPKDVEGWDKIKWGMTLKEARSAYKSEAPPSGNEYWTLQWLTTIKVGDISMDANAMAKPESDHVVRVRLELIYYLHPEGPSGPVAFDTLRTLLMQKYGTPSSDETKTKFGDPVHDVLWTFPSTSILLELTKISVDVDYRATDKKALDVL